MARCFFNRRVQQIGDGVPFEAHRQSLAIISCATTNIAQHIDIYLLSFLSTHTFDGCVEGINDLQAQYQELYGPGDYTPDHLGHLLVVPLDDRPRPARTCSSPSSASGSPARGRAAEAGVDLEGRDLGFPLSLAAMIVGWIFTEMGRQPWIVFSLHVHRGRRLAERDRPRRC